MHHRDELLPDHCTLNYMSQNQTEFEQVTRHRWDSSPYMSLYSVFIAMRTSVGRLPVVFEQLEGEVNSVVTEMVLERVLFMAAFARWRTWCQDFVVRCRYWISIAGQGIRRANGHQLTVQAWFPIHWFHVGGWDKRPFNLYTRTLIAHPTAHPTLLSPNNGYENC